MTDIDALIEFAQSTPAEEIDDTWVLTDVVREEPPADLFQVPPGYQKRD